MKLQKTSTPFSAERPIATGSKAKVRKSNRKVIFLAVLAFVCFGLASVHAGTVYITADNLEGTNLFGTLDVATGQFSQIASTDPVFL